MNYNSFTKHTYTIEDGAPNDTNALLLLGNGNKLEFDDYHTSANSDLIALMNACTYAYNTQEILGVFYHNKEGFYNLILNSRVDFVTFYNGSDSQLHIDMGNYLTTLGDDYYPLEDGGAQLTNYLFYPSGQNPSNYYETQVNAFSVNLASEYHSVYDFTNTTDGDNFRSNSFSIGNIATYYYHVFNINGNVDDLQIGIGTPLSDVDYLAQETAYNNGYLKGRQEGYLEGYDLGASSGGVDAHTYNAFGYISQTFRGVTSLLEIEVLPHITLGLCFSIPVVLVMILVLFRMLKK